MGCKFCASTLGGLIRNLTASEMLEQIYAIERITGETVSNVVVMGTGEPMDNYDNFVRFVRILSAKEGKNISVRNITVRELERPAGKEVSTPVAEAVASAKPQKKKTHSMER